MALRKILKLLGNSLGIVVGSVLYFHPGVTVKGNQKARFSKNNQY